MSSKISRIVFYMLLVIVGVWILNARLPEPGNRPRSELAAFSTEPTFTTIWSQLQRARQAELRGDYLRDFSLSRAESAYQRAHSNCRAAQKANPEPGFLNRIISDHCFRVSKKLKRLENS